MDNVVNLSPAKLRELFSETAAIKGINNTIVEKDFWVTWVLYKIFNHAALSQILIFKGGTSLSKIFNVIQRFSEDIDLVLDWTKITDENPLNVRSKTKQNDFNHEINLKAQNYICNDLLPIFSELLFPFCQCQIDKENPFTINVKYKAVFKDKYLRPEILLEIGPLASFMPSDDYTVTSFVAECFNSLFSQTRYNVKAIIAERTFWEKATILHHEANRPNNILMPLRYSRHYYDLAMLAKSSIKDNSLANPKLLENVVKFKQQFYPRGWAKYENAKFGTLALIPPDYRVKELQKDYANMREMLFGDYINLDEIMRTLHLLEGEINDMAPIS